MNAESYLLVLNATEGFLQLAIGNTPEHLLAPDQARTRDGSGAWRGSEQAREFHQAQESHKTEETPKSQKIQKRGASPLKCSQEWRLPSQGTELLAPALSDLAARLDIQMAQISHIACVTGPGSFTGIRLTTTSAGGLAMATGALMGGLSYLPLLAHNASLLLQGTVETSTTLWVVTHARRDLVHAQAFAFERCGEGREEQCASEADGKAENLGGGLALRVLQPEVLVLALDELVALVNAQKSPSLLLGSGATRNKAYLLANLNKMTTAVLHESFDVPQPSILFEFACNATYGLDELMPDYVRVSDAEEALESIALKLGLDAEEAKTAYLALQKE